MAVGLTLGHIVGADGTVGARLVLDDDALPEARLEFVGEEPRDHVGRSPGRERDDDPDDARGVVLRDCRRAGQPA